MVAIQYTLSRGASKASSTDKELLSLYLPLRSSTTLHDVVKALEAKHDVFSVDFVGPNLREVHDGTYSLNLDPYQPKCADKFYMLGGGGLYRHRGAAGAKFWLDHSTKLEPLLMLQDLFGSSSSLLQVVGYPRAPAEAEFFVTTLTSKMIPIRASAFTTIKEMKHLIHNETGTPPDQQRLIGKGKQLENDRTLGDYGITPDITLHLVLRLRGGMYHETSGRRDNTEIGNRPLTATQVTVVVPGHGEVEVMVPLTRDFTGKDLMQAAQQAAQHATAAAAMLASPQHWPSLQDSRIQRHKQQQQQHNHSSNRNSNRKPRQQ